MFLLVLGLDVCAASPLRLSEPGPSRPHHPLSTDCPVWVTTLADSRVSPEVIGLVFRRTLYAPVDRMGWLRDEVSRLDGKGVAVGFDAEPQPGALRAQVTLMKAWFRVLETSEIGTVTLHVRVEGAFERDYQDDSSGIQLRAARSDIGRRLNSAFDDAMTKLAVDARKACQDRAGGR